MVRPEQITLETVSDPSAAPLPGFGQVIEAEFAGANCTVSIRLCDASRILVPVPAAGLPEPGAVVRFAVTGSAHVFPGR